MKVKVKLLTPTAKLPTKAHPTDACFDIYADYDKREFWNIIKYKSN